MADASGLHREMLDAVSARDFDKLREMYHPDYTYLSSDGNEQKGAEAGVAVAQMYTSAFPDIVLEVRHLHSCGGDTSVMEFTARGTHKGELEGIPPTGKSVEMLICDVIEVRDGKVYREREYFDAMSMMQQLGVIPAS
jgi:steroid delta-isomerase-like uncharacterized protein